MTTAVGNSLSSLASRAAVVVMLLLLFMSSASQSQLSSTFNENACPNALSTIRAAIRTAIASERRMAASLIRLHFHDCFVQILVLCRFNLISCPYYQQMHDLNGVVSCLLSGM